LPFGVQQRAVFTMAFTAMTPTPQGEAHGAESGTMRS
jgi:hypothetical protein